MNIVVCTDSEIEWNVSFVKQYYPVNSRDLNAALGDAYMWYRGYQRTFMLQEVTITFWGSAVVTPVYFSMPSSYIIDDVAVIKAWGSEKRPVTVMLTEVTEST
jgi:hypothetical protein